MNETTTEWKPPEWRNGDKCWWGAFDHHFLVWGQAWPLADIKANMHSWEDLIDDQYYISGYMFALHYVTEQIIPNLISETTDA